MNACSRLARPSLLLQETQVPQLIRHCLAAAHCDEAHLAQAHVVQHRELCQAEAMSLNGLAQGGGREWGSGFHDQ